jgi:hypothetical protein
MTKKQPFILTATAIAVLLALVALAIGWVVERGDGSLLRNVAFSETTLTPNADGDNDALTIQYQLSRNATVSIYLEDSAGQRYYFRREKERGADEYSVLFSGIVEAYSLPDDAFQGTILERLLQDGTYTWVVEATDANGTTSQESGTLTVANADTTLPEMRGFELDKKVLTPNRDGISDRMQAQFYLTKEADYNVYLLTESGRRIPIGELEREVVTGAVGRHYFDYEGGVDNGETPPDDGVYTIVAFAEDKIGQKMQVEDTVEIRFGGVPRADIVAPATGDQVEFSTTAWTLCDTLYFTLTIENYGEAPIRTTGPTPDTVYDSDWNYNTLGWHTESGAWRVAIGYEDEVKNYPFRWAVGNAEDLTEIDGHLYLMPGDRATVSGGIRLTGELGLRDPQLMYAGLIHEDVEIAQFNSRVDPKAVVIDLPSGGDEVVCAERDVPVKGE